MSEIVSQREDIFTSLEPWHGKCVSVVKRVKIPACTAFPKRLRALGVSDLLWLPGRTYLIVCGTLVRLQNINSLNEQLRFDYWDVLF